MSLSPPPPRRQRWGFIKITASETGARGTPEAASYGETSWPDWPGSMGQRLWPLGDVSPTGHKKSQTQPPQMPRHVCLSCSQPDPKQGPGAPWGGAPSTVGMWAGRNSALFQVFGYLEDLIHLISQLNKQLWEASTWLSHELLEALLWPFRSDPEGGARSRTWQQPLPPGTLQVQRPADPSPTAVARFPAPERWLLTRSLLPASTQGSLQQPWGVRGPGQRDRPAGRCSLP